jgi:hypothetical protein
MLRQLSFPSSVSGADVEAVLERVAGENLEAVDLSGCSKLTASAIQAILQRLAGTCPALKRVDIAGCSDAVVLCALAMRTRDTFAHKEASPAELHSLVKTLVKDAARCPLPSLLNLLQKKAPQLVLDPTFVPRREVFLEAVAAACEHKQCAANGAAADVVAILVSVLFPCQDPAETRVFDR